MIEWFVMFVKLIENELLASWVIFRCVKKSIEMIDLENSSKFVRVIR